MGGSAAAPRGPPAERQIHLRHTLITHKSPDARSFSTQCLSPCLVWLGIQSRPVCVRCNQTTASGLLCADFCLSDSW